MNERLKLFEGKEVECVSLKLLGSPDQIAYPAEEGTDVAGVFTGRIERVSFFRQDGRMVRQQVVGLRRVVQMDYGDGLQQIVDIDRAIREGQGVHELPFDGTDI
jgi:hypothetical protein